MAQDNLQTPSFRDILEEKMASLESEKQTFSDINASQTQTSHEPLSAPFDLMSQLLHSTEAIFFEKGAGFSLYKSAHKSAHTANKTTESFFAKTQKPSRPTAPEKTVLFTQLTSAQKTALEKIIALGGIELKVSDANSPAAQILGETRLKKCFRRLAKAFHPDHATTSTTAQKQKSSQDFRELRESYNIVIGAFAADKKAA